MPYVVFFEIYKLRHGIYLNHLDGSHMGVMIAPCDALAAASNPYWRCVMNDFEKIWRVLECFSGENCRETFCDLHENFVQACLDCPVERYEHQPFEIAKLTEPILGFLRCLWRIHNSASEDRKNVKYMWPKKHHVTLSKIAYRCQVYEVLTYDLMGRIEDIHKQKKLRSNEMVLTAACNLINPIMGIMRDRRKRLG